MNTTNLEELIPQLDGMDVTQLKTMLTSLGSLLQKIKECITVKCQSPPPQPPKLPPVKMVDDSLYQFDPKPNIDAKLLLEVEEHLTTLQFHPSSSRAHSPDIHLFGSQKYGYNKQSANVLPTPIVSDSPIGVLLGIVNGLVGADFNSVLINRYRNVKCYLGPHKDDEDCLDDASPISTLSLGATRRLLVCTNEDKTKPVKTLFLTPRSIFTMQPGFQELYYHAIAAGRKSRKDETGPRYSITFRRIDMSTADRTPATIAKKEHESSHGHSSKLVVSLKTLIPLYLEAPLSRAWMKISSLNTVKTLRYTAIEVHLSLTFTRMLRRFKTLVSWIPQRYLVFSCNVVATTWRI